MTMHAPEPAGQPQRRAAAGTPYRGGNLDDLRRRNLSSVLRAVHLHDGLSRADVTRQAGLNRSTVRALVADLVDAGIVVEGTTARSGGVGRPSARLHATDAVRVLSVNPEVDTTTAALVGLGGRVLARDVVRHDQAPTPAQVVDAVSTLLGRLAPDGRVSGIGVAVPGLVDTETGTVVLAPHLGWEDVPLASMLAGVLTQQQGAPRTTSGSGTVGGGRTSGAAAVVVDNDANCGVVAESLFGAGRGYGSVVYLNGGASGIGGSTASDGVLTVGRHGYGGEVGHTLVSAAGLPCHCGADGCLETEVTRSGLLAALGGVAPSRLDDELRLQCAGREPGSPASPAATEVDRQLRFLGVALRTVVNVLNPERVILGGFLESMVTARGMHAVEAELARALPGARDDVKVVTAELGSDILAVGAAQLVLRSVIADPLGNGLGS